MQATIDATTPSRDTPSNSTTTRRNAPEYDPDIDITAISRNNPENDPNINPEETPPSKENQSSTSLDPEEDKEYETKREMTDETMLSSPKPVESNLPPGISVVKGPIIEPQPGPSAPRDLLSVPEDQVPEQEDQQSDPGPNVNHIVSFANGLQLDVSPGQPERLPELNPDEQVLAWLHDEVPRGRDQSMGTITCTCHVGTICPEPCVCPALCSHCRYILKKKKWKHSLTLSQEGAEQWNTYTAED